jgi:methionyl-tRNA formyltransferase
MNIIFFGTPKEVVPILESLTKHFDVVTVVTAPDQKSGRKQLLSESPVKTFAQTQNIPVITPQQWNNETIEQVQIYNPDLLVVAAYGKLIPDEVLEIPKFGAINIHPSLLPKYRGSTPIQTTLLNGDQISGITFMKMDKQMDHGSILHQIPFTLESTDTFAWLMQSKFAQAGQVLPHIIEEYVAGKIKPQPQDESKATYTKIITKQDGFIDLEHPPKPDQLDRMIRAYYPWPSVWTTIRIKNKEVRIKFLPSSVIASEALQSHTTLYAIQIEGKNPMNINDFLNGYPEMKEKIEKLYP